MIAPSLQTAVETLHDLVDHSEVILPFTGAGISTECGIPDFRSPGGLWTKNQPIPYDLFVSSQEMRDEAWRRRFAMDGQFPLHVPDAATAPSRRFTTTERCAESSRRTSTICIRRPASL